MQSVTVSDRLIERFKLMEVYESKFRVDAHSQANWAGRLLIND